MNETRKNELPQEFVPVDEWPDVSTMLVGFGEPDLPDSRSLIGQEISTEALTGERTKYSFLTMNAVKVSKGAGREGASPEDHVEETGYYRAVEVRDGIFFIDVLLGEGTKTVNSSLVVDFGDGRVTHARSWFVNRNGQVRTQTEILTEGLGAIGELHPRARTSALVGKRIYYRYSPTEAYEHVYFNKGTMAWQCVKGGEKGLADVEQVAQYELADDIYIFHWTETVMPVESFLIVDLKNERSIGRMFCWEETSLDPVHLPFDSRLTVLNETVYPVD